MYKKVMFWLTLLCLILLILIAQKVGVFAVIVDTDFFVLVEKITKNVYFSGVSCSIIAVIIIYKWQVWYSKKKLKQNFRCNECIQSIYNGIEKFREYAPLIPEKKMITVIIRILRRKMHRDMQNFITNISSKFIARIWNCRMKEMIC